MNDKLAAALDLARRGLPVFPLIENGKTPAFAGWQDVATTDEAIIEQWFGGPHRNGNIGVATGRGVMVVDADAKNGGRGVQSLELMEMLGADLDFVVETPSGGRHAYFRLPDGTKVPNSVRALAEYPDIDIRGEGGLVVAPGSVIGKQTYRIVRDGRIPESQEWLTAAAVGAKKLREKSSATPAADLDQKSAVDRATLYLTQNAPLAIEGAGGDDTTYRVAAHIKDYGLSAERNLELLSELWNPKCSPPWDVDDLEAKVLSAYKSGTSAPGAKSADAEFDVIVIADRHPPSPFVRPSTFGDGEPPTREWAVEGWIPAGKTTLISGDGGVGKTLVAQQLLTAVATPGATWFDKKVIHGPVLGVFSEDDTNEMWRRQIDVCRSTGIPLSGLNDVNWWTLDSVAAEGCVLMSFTRENPEGRIAPFFKRLDAAMAVLKPVMVVLDPIANMFGGNELDRAQVTGFVNRTLNRLCVKHGSTVIALVHPSLSGITEGSGRSGSTGWANAVRSRLYLTRPQNDKLGDYRELRPTKNNYGRLDEEIKLRWHDGAFVRATPGGDTDPLRVAMLSLLSAIAIVISRGDPMTTSKQSPYYTLKQVRGLPEVKGVAPGMLEEAFETLLREGKLVAREIRTPNGRRSLTSVEIALDDNQFERADGDFE